MSAVVRVYLDGWRVAITGKPGRKYTPIVPLAERLAVKLVDNRSARDFQMVPMSTRRAAKRFLVWGRECGMTPGARKLLREAAR